MVARICRVGKGPWDVVHFNFGLYDIDYGEFVPLENYTNNLEYIWSRIVPKLTQDGLSELSTYRLNLKAVLSLLETAIAYYYAENYWA